MPRRITNAHLEQNNELIYRFDCLFYYNYRSKGRREGVSIYVYTSLPHNLIDNICENDNHFLWIHLKKFSLDVGAIYKPERTNNENFLDTYSQQLEKRKRAIVFGDFNYNLLKKNQATINYKEMLLERGFKILNKINSAYNTRETSSTKTILDHVCSNIKNHKFHLAVVDSAMSDHKHIYLEIHKYEPGKKEKIYLWHHQLW